MGIYYRNLEEAYELINIDISYIVITIYNLRVYFARRVYSKDTFFYIYITVLDITYFKLSTKCFAPSL